MYLGNSKIIFISENDNNKDIDNYYYQINNFIEIMN